MSEPERDRECHFCGRKRSEDAAEGFGWEEGWQVWGAGDGSGESFDVCYWCAADSEERRGEDDA